MLSFIGTITSSTLNSTPTTGTDGTVTANSSITVALPGTSCNLLIPQADILNFPTGMTVVVTVDKQTSSSSSTTPSS